MQKSRYGKTDVVEEFLRYPFNGPVKYDFDYTGTFSKYSIVDKNYVDTLVKPHKRLISGGAEWGAAGLSLQFSTSNLYYTFTGEILVASASNSIFAAGGSQNRIDAVVIEEGGQLAVVQGAPAAIPTRPTLSDNQILVQYAYIPAGATVIGASEQIYANNSQWTTISYQLSGSLTGTFNAGFTGDDYASGSCVQLDSDYTTGVRFTKPLGQGLTASLYGSLSMRIKFVSVVPDNKCLFAQIQGTANGAAVFGNTVNLMAYGLNRDTINQWQHVVVPTSKFGTDIALIESLTLRMAGGSTASNTLWRADYILLQQGRAFDGYMGEPDAVGGIGGSNTVTGNVIGPAEDGDYTDGVFTDFSPTTPIGTAVDRFNELFLALVPSSAPSLLAGDWSGSRAVAGVNGKLSFDDSNPIAGSTYFGANTAPSPVNVDGSWSASGKRLSIFAASNTSNFSGVLASSTPVHTGVPTPAYPANSFGDATSGDLTLSLNGLIVSTASLSNPGSIDTTSGSSVSGFVLSPATYSKFPTGSPFVTNTPSFLSRTGQWLLRGTDPRIRNGYNYIIAEHKSTSFTRTLTRFEFIVDDNSTATVFTASTITSFALTGSKYLSGIGYYTGGTIYYNATMSNMYRNTYYSASNAITFNDASTAGNAGTNPILSTTVVGGSSQYGLLNSGGNELRDVGLAADFNSSNPLGFNILSSVRRLNDPIGLSVNTKRTLQGDRTGGTQSITNVYLDNVSASSNNSTTEGFDDENFRLKGEGTGLSYSLITDITTLTSTSGVWASTQSLVGSDSYHNTGLQVYNSRLIYPVTNFSSHGTSTATNLNFGDSERNYATATGVRTYIRSFYNATTYGNFKITINGSGGTFVAKSTPITGTNNIWVEMKLPGTSTPTTGWLDCYNAFNETIPGPWDDGKGGWKSSGGAGKAFGAIWGLTTGSRNNSTSGGYVVIKITVAQGFTGQFTGLTFTWG